MARLQMSSGALVPAPSYCLIGRSRRCALRLTTPEVSSEHALLRWRGGVWELQDLHSRNGTYVRGARLDSGQRVELMEGDVIGCGRLGGLVLVDAGPPIAFARRLQDDAIFEAHGGLLALPASDAPELMIYEHGEAWLGERNERGDGEPSALEVLEDGSVVETSEGRWVLALPRSLPRTAEADDGALVVAALHLVFGVSADHEHVELVAEARGRRFDFAARAYHYPLLLLARARLADRHLPPAKQGWMYQDELLRQLGSSHDRLYVDIHRLRRQLAEAGVADAVHIIERRRGSHQLRIGAASLEIVALAGR